MLTVVADKAYHRIVNPIKSSQRKARQGPKRGSQWLPFGITIRYCSWKKIPLGHTPYQTCHRRFHQCVKRSAFWRNAKELDEDLHQRNGLGIREAFIDGNLDPTNKGGIAVGKSKRGKGTIDIAIAAAPGFPVAAPIDSAYHQDVKIV